MSTSKTSKNNGSNGPRRGALPEQLPNATDFSSDRAQVNPKWFIETMKQRPEYWRPLKEATELSSPYGRNRIDGHWALAYLAFVVSGDSDVEPFWGTAGHSIWTCSGFTKGRPSLRATQRRFAELEKVEDAFLEIAKKMIAHAVKASGGRVGRDIHVDSTESETHARLKHICPEDSPCHERKARFVTASLTSDEAREHRHQEAEQPEDQMVELSAGQVDKVEFDAPPSPYDDKLGRKVKKVKVGGCWYACLDPDAGIRAYIRHGKVKRFWVGYYNGKAIDHYTGAPVGVLVHSASLNEATTYPELYERAFEATGKAPRAVVADRGYSLSAVFEHNTKRGVATVAPWRARTGKFNNREMEDTDRYDRHGIVRCKYCGGPTTQLRFTAGDKPRQWVKCAEPAPGSDCESKTQTIMCSEDWRLLVPLWRNTEAYLALEDSSRAYERVHHLWRSRYRVGADTHHDRPKRRGRATQQLRATVALIAEWLQILHREGWLGSARRLLRESRLNTAKRAVEKLTDFRAAAGLDKPYGEIAKQLGIGALKPKPRLASG